MPSLKELLELNLNHYDSGEFGDDHTDMIEITAAGLKALIIAQAPKKFPKIEIEGMDDESACGAKMWNSAILDYIKAIERL